MNLLMVLGIPVCVSLLIDVLAGPVELLILLFLIASLRFSELYICGAKFAHVSVDYSVCFACYVFDGVGELFAECVCYLFVCSGCFVSEGDSVVVCLSRFFVS